MTNGPHTTPTGSPPYARPDEEAERRALIWLVDGRTHGGPLERRFASTIIDTLAWFESEPVDE